MPESSDAPTIIVPDPPAPATCATCSHSRPSSADELRQSLRRGSMAGSDGLAAVTLEHHPEMAEALRSVGAWRFCSHHGDFVDAAYTCPSHTSGTVALGVPVPVDAPPVVTACGFCGRDHDRCFACSAPRGVCAKCSCSATVSVWTRKDGSQRWECTECDKRGDGPHPFPALVWPNEHEGHRYCDGCIGTINDAAKYGVTVRDMLVAADAFSRMNPQPDRHAWLTQRFPPKIDPAISPA